MKQVRLKSMAAQPATMEFFERRALEDFMVAGRKFSPKISINLQVDYIDSIWIISLPFLDAVGRSTNYSEAKRMVLEYIDFLWAEYVLSSENELGETGKILRDTLLELFMVS
jgi:hypothetical protein